MGAVNAKYEKKNESQKKLNIENIQINESNKSDYELFEKISSISKELYTTYHQHFLNDNFCKQLSTIYKKKLFELDIQSLQNIYNQVNGKKNSTNSTNSENNTNSGRKLQAVLSYSPNQDEKFIVNEFKSQLREYLWNQEIQMNPKIFANKGIVLDNIPMTIIDPQNKLRYINISHVNRILADIQQNHKSETKNEGKNEGKNQNQYGGANNNNNNGSSSSFPFSTSSSSLNSSRSISSSNLPFNNGLINNENININKNKNKKNKNANGNVNMNMNMNKNGKNKNRGNKNKNGKNTNVTNVTNPFFENNGNNFAAFKKKIQNVGREFNLKNQGNQGNQGNQNKEENNSKIKFVVNNKVPNNNNELQQFLQQIPQPGKIGNKRNERNLMEAVEENINKMIRKSATSFNIRNYKEPSRFCTSGEKCMLTKSELCKGITEHFIIRGNIIASILSTLPYKTSNGFEGGYCYQRFLNLDKCQVCLPHNYNELMSMDPKTRIQTMMLFINYMTEKECNENNGLFRKLTLGEKKSLLQHGRSGDEFNLLYTEYTQNVRQKYIEHLNILLEILQALSSMEGIQNEELNALSLKTKETIDSMVHLCQFYYLYAIIALLNANISPIKSEETNRKNQLRNNMKQFLVSL